eukprot:TRINITY_DN8985_c0_g1_i4.p1 TRINITY_DN8985_c0_g1~~TRINITY_DN8985_c0_g1_i4.p1  ORF type:complete len:279 (+),score=88.29 TRINITY_DN8985_c0_g1_i4:240-1076(+)
MSFSFVPSLLSNDLQEDWTMQLASTGAIETSMYELNAGAPDEVRAERRRVLEARRKRLEGAVGTRNKESTEAIKERNRKALEQLRKSRAERLPEGWKMVESKSRPGEYVYENVHTEERQAWFPKEPAVQVDAKVYDQEPKTAPEGALSEAAKERNRKALAARKAKKDGFLPEGWRRVESKSRPGEYVYENIYTEERVAWYPIDPAAKQAMPEQQFISKKDVEKAKALYDYTAANNEEIDLQQGDVVTVEFKADNGWWIGSNSRTGALGLYPGGFVEMM